MPNFQNSKIYTIRSHQTDDVYVGSTTQTLPQRLGKHRSAYKNYTPLSGGYVSSFEILQYPDHYIELLEAYPCNNKDELRQREGQLIRETANCVNKYIAGRTSEQYYQDNAEKVKQYQKKYKHDNTESIKIKNKQYYQDNADMLREKKRKYYQENLEKIKKYRQDNADNIKARRSKKISCSYCNCTFALRYKARHVKSKKHIDNYKQAYLECWGEEFDGTITSADY